MPDETPPVESLPDFADEWMQQWKRASRRLSELRRQELRNMTESDAARIFEMLEPLRPYELRTDSGLVRQQVKFRQLRKRQIAEAE